MVSSGATVLFIDKKYTDSQRMWQVPLEHPIHLHNIHGTLNEAGSITHKVKFSLKIGQDEETFEFYVTKLGPEKVILGLPWLRHSNPTIDWQAGTMHLNADVMFLDYLIVLSDSLSLGLSSFSSHLFNSTPCVLCTISDDLLIRPCDVLPDSMRFYHRYKYH
jgi:hypothetical protein